MNGTVKMGNPGDPNAAVNHQFRVLGIDGLRVADMSVVPVLPHAHTQAFAYVAGATCAEKLIDEYCLS
jgi:choline dehydrogenase-like flavoprotein